MVKRYRINYKKRGRFCPIVIKNEDYKEPKVNKDRFFSFGGYESEDKTEKKRKPSKNLNTNRRLLQEIKKYLQDPLFSSFEQSRLVDLKQKLEAQIQNSDTYDQKKLVKFIKRTISSIFNPPKPLNL